MALREGQTGTAPDGTRVVVRGGQVVPLYDAPVAGGAVGAKAYNQQYGKKAADLDIADLEEIKQIRNNAGAISANAYEADRLLDSKPNLTGPLFEPAQAAARLFSWSPTVDKDRLTNMTQFEQLASEGVLENVKKLPGPLSEKELAFLSRTTYDKGANPEENYAIARKRASAAKKLTSYADARQYWIDNYASTRNKNERGQSFDQFWQGFGGLDWTPDDMRPKGQKQFRQGGLTAEEAWLKSGKSLYQLNKNGASFADFKRQYDRGAFVPKKTNKAGPPRKGGKSNDPLGIR